MPKIRDLGIKVIPETMRPPEVGGGTGCGFTTCGVSPAAQRVCLPTHFGCTDCTVQAFSICGTTPGPAAQAQRICNPTVGCTDCTVQQFSICGGTHCGTVTHGCSDCTVQQFSLCGTTPHNCGLTTCSDCTVQQFSICGTTPGNCGVTTCSDCTVQQFSLCGTTPHHCGVTTCSDCTVQQFSICGTTPGHCGGTYQACHPTYCGVTVGCTAPFSLCGPISPRCGVSIDPTIVQQQPEITVEQIAKMKDALRQQITALEEHEKTLGPKTLDEIDAREKQLNAELDALKARRKDLK
jgi:hypothetical protein